MFLAGNPVYYVRFDFVLAARLSFQHGGKAMTPFLQALELEPGVLSGLRGEIQYHEAFDQADS